MGVRGALARRCPFFDFFCCDVEERTTKMMRSILDEDLSCNRNHIDLGDRATDLSPTRSRRVCQSASCR